jgi:hypothetical protein
MSVRFFLHARLHSKFPYFDTSTADIFKFALFDVFPLEDSRKAIRPGCKTCKPFGKRLDTPQFGF